jgi:hypothetical protein
LLIHICGLKRNNIMVKTFFVLCLECGDFFIIIFQILYFFIFSVTWRKCVTKIIVTHIVDFILNLNLYKDVKVLSYSHILITEKRLYHYILHICDNNIILFTDLSLPVRSLCVTILFVTCAKDDYVTVFSSKTSLGQ